MASAATAKRRNGLNNSGRKATKRSASGGVKNASKVTPGLAKSKSMQEQPTATAIDVAPQNASISGKSEKRRLAALMTWEKRRRNSLSGKKASGAKKAAAASKSKLAAARPVTPPKGRKRVAPKKAVLADAAAAPPAKKRKVGAGPSVRKASASKGSKHLAKIRRQKRVQPAATHASSNASSHAVERPLVAAADVLSAKKKKTAVAPKKIYTLDERREAAKRGWERRRRNQLGVDCSASPSANASSLEEKGSSAAPATSVSVMAEKVASAPKKIYTASARSQAAKLGWERRQKSKAKAASSSNASMSSTAALPSKTSAKPQPPKKENNGSSRQKGTKRSRRLAAAEDPESTDTYKNETRTISELVTYLRTARGWMEFHPSSRHGSGTATYGYIPSSIASFVRSGTIPRQAVLEHGDLGVHYALDWDGYGGLKDMISTFGEDYSPFPTEEMMASSRVTEWELGDDLPWREVVEAEEQKLRRLEQEMISAKVHGSRVAARNDDDVEDILFVANILANLDRSASEECKHGEGPDNNIMSLEGSPSILTLNYYEDSNRDSEGEACKVQRTNPLSQLATVAMKEYDNQCNTPPKIVGEDVIFVQNPFKRWNFGIC
eukprot:CAMPEP_0181085770 /NCGR_PEP_ID=MMETSP1071-20121207/5400_1 /TAXON_ID=35127 /ORGANISM="Thalassiosira sp., Strain NH16" /LENGTH=609 /DNA_ID=CAMNT_0023167581 /DNA_START=69 /DNA_END=1898 /DNA_ORIENTATION=+